MMASSKKGRQRYECRLPLPEMPPDFPALLARASPAELRMVRAALLRAARNAPEPADRGRASAYADIIGIVLARR